jgi:tryptophanyl-tRNA synthetase
MLSGIQPSGDLHLGNYLGAIKNWADRVNDYDCYYFMADMHTITVRQDPKELRRRSLEMLAIYIACGLDPEKNTLFLQSHVPAHAQLGWLLDCYTMFGELTRMTQFKDKSEKHKDNINAGLFTYPSLMAADILLYQPHYVPVGEDQKQHVELCRNIANRFNNIYGEVFRVPEPFISKVGARIYGLTTPEQKMSKSIPQGCVFLMDEPNVIMKKFKRAITDSDTEHCVRYDREAKPGVANLMNIYATITGKSFEEIEREFDGRGYGDFKLAVGEAVAETLAPIQARLTALMADKAQLEALMKQSAEHASYVANRTLTKARKRLGYVNL